MPQNTAILRSQVESQLQGRVVSPFARNEPRPCELVSSGIPEIDSLAGGLPRGALVEICGSPGSGRMTVLLSALAARTADAEACALIDVHDTFDPLTAAAAGVALDRLLWVRCQNLDQGLRAADLLIQSGGFGLVAMDMSEVAPRTVRQISLNVWFRFRRSIEDTPTILMLLAQESSASCASLVFRLQPERAHWSNAISEESEGVSVCSSHKILRNGAIRASLVRSRVKKTVTPFREDHWFTADSSEPSRRFETKMIWAEFPAYNPVFSSRSSATADQLSSAH